MRWSASARSMNCSPASARMRFLSSEGWKAKSKPASVLIAESLAIWTAILTRRFSRDGQLFGQQGVDGLDGADLAALDAAQGDVEDFQRPRHLQGDEGGLDALDDGRRAHRTPPRRARRRPTAA